MKNIALIVVLFVFGCTKPIQNKDVVVILDENTQIDKKPEPAPVPPEKTEASFKVEAPKNIVDAVHQVLGDSGSIPPKKDLPVVAGGTKVTIHPGSTIDYSYNPEKNSMLFVFNEPRPTVEAGFSIFKIRPPLLSLVLTPDNVGTATVRTALGEVQRKFTINWADDTSSSGIASVEENPEKLPEVWCYSMDGCPPCEKAKKDFEAAKKILPFYPIWKEKPPEWMTEDRPQFWFHVSKDQPSQEDVANTRHKKGYTNLKDLIDVWAHNRQKKQ